MPDFKYKITSPKGRFSMVFSPPIFLEKVAVLNREHLPFDFDWILKVISKGLIFLHHRFKQEIFVFRSTATGEVIFLSKVSYEIDSVKRPMLMSVWDSHLYLIINYTLISYDISSVFEVRDVTEIRLGSKLMSMDLKSSSICLQKNIIIIGRD